MVLVENGFLGLAGSLAIWGGNTFAVTARGNVMSIFGQIMTDAGLTEEDLHGNTTNKMDFWEQAAEMGVHMNIGVKSWAENKTPADPVLAAAMHYVLSDLDRGAIQEVLVSMNFILGKVSLIPVLDLPNVNILPAEIVTFTSQIAALTLANPQYRIGQILKKAANSDIAGQFVLLRGAMGKQDNMIHTFKYTQKTFVVGYDNSRKIIDLGKGMKTAEAVLHPLEHVAWFKDKYLPKDTLTLRNHSVLGSVKIFVSDGTTVPTTGGYVLAPDSEIKLEIPGDLGGVFGHNVIVESLSATDDIHVTGILASGKSSSSAPSPPLA
jgi:hypothetical protein